MSIKLTLSLFVTALAIVHSANILDLLNWEDGKKLLDAAIQPQGKAEVRNDINCKWKCKGPACACCIDTNVTAYDKSEAKCIHMRYMSKEEGFFVQISHGKKVEYDKIHTTDPGRLCIFTSVMFQMCTVFSHMAPTTDGLRGCVHLEPGTIFAYESKIPLGCFKANDAGIEMMEAPKDLVLTEEENTEDSGNSDDEGETDVGFDQKLLEAVYESTKNSIALITSLFETPTDSTKPPTSTEATSSEAPEAPTEITQNRGPKYLKHPNQL